MTTEAVGAERLREMPFAVGDIVETIKGAKFWGEVVSCYEVPVPHTTCPACYGKGYIRPNENCATCDGMGWRKDWRADVRAVAPDFLGTIHVYPTAQLALRSETPAPLSGIGEDEVEVAIKEFLRRTGYPETNGSYADMRAALEAAAQVRQLRNAGADK